MQYVTFLLVSFLAFTPLLALACEEPVAASAGSYASSGSEASVFNHVAPSFHSYGGERRTSVRQWQNSTINQRAYADGENANAQNFASIYSSQKFGD